MAPCSSPPWWALPEVGTATCSSCGLLMRRLSCCACGCGHGDKSHLGFVLHLLVVVILMTVGELHQEFVHCLSNQGFDGGQRSQLGKARRSGPLCLG